VRPSREQLTQLAAEYGFQVNPLEKVIRLLDLLDTLRSHPFLKSRLVLKGGGALNLFLFEVPRLSVDIDLNYIGAADRQTMKRERPKVDQAIRAVCERQGYEIRRVPEEHAGGKWRTVRVADVQAAVEDVDRRLVPLLRHDLLPDREERGAWSEKLASDCRSLLSRVLPLAPREIEFLDLLNDKGEVAPERLTSDEALQARILLQPALQWKAQNVRRHKGLNPTRELGSGDGIQ